MVEKNYWFVKKEYDRRLARVQAKLLEQGHDALLAFMPGVTWLTGFLPAPTPLSNSRLFRPAVRRR